jgi:hypothetical protein
MPSFKHKTNKKLFVDNKKSMTLDGVHRELQMEFNMIETEKLPALYKEKNDILVKLKTNKNTGVLNITKQIELNDRLYDIKKEISDNKRKIRDYYLNNSSYIFDYFENKKEITNGTNKTKKLNSFFKLDKSVNENELNRVNENNVQKFFTNLDQRFFNVNDYVIATDICVSCNRGEMIPVEHEGIMVCNVCAKQVTYLIENEKPSYKEPPKEACFYAYKRINHFKEILAQFQAKETTQIPEEVITAIRNRIKKVRIKDMKELNYDKMREILRKLGLNKYFEHIQYINSIFGIKPPIMNEQLHETLCVLFIEIQQPWAIHCPVNRTNFFNYTYTLYQLCVLLGQTQYLPYIPLMKDRTKQLEQDMIWKKVCEDLDWEFCGTI